MNTTNWFSLTVCEWDDAFSKFGVIAKTVSHWDGSFSVSAVADATGIDKRTVRFHLGQLVALGCVKVLSGYLPTDQRFLLPPMGSGE